jgi:Holliday junction resolvasome RuvABC endonuclease subunit
MNDATILALDASSTTIGWVLYAGRVLYCGEHKLQGDDIAVRCQTAYEILALLLNRFPQIDCLAIEAPVARFAKAVIPQARVSGALMTCAAQRWKHVIEVTPAAGKLALAGKGNASKDTMMARARAYGVSGEHASDALGVALAAATKVEVEHAV